MLLTTIVRAGGGPENLLLIIDPSNAESLYLGNYYKNARNVPDSNVFYMNPYANDYATFASQNLAAFFGELDNRGITGHIDYVLIPPGGSFFITAPVNTINDLGCNGGHVQRISISSAYTLAHIAAQMQAAASVTDTNQYYATTDPARDFDHDIKWLSGAPSGSAAAKQYYIGFMLGYTGERGNTIQEIIDMVNRSVAADGTRPSGTFYFMMTSDSVRSNPRDPFFPATISAIQALGGQAVQINATLPEGNHDCLGILTGASDPAIDAANITLKPGSFADHLTSWAATFDIASQVKMSRWIAKGNPLNGASGTMGTVEEPCVVGSGNSWKFPHPRFHLWYYQGTSLGEALLRSVSVTPFQSLFYGDPLTRTFAYLPVVTVPNAPSGTVSGTILLTPSATTSRPSTTIASHDLYVDSQYISSVSNGNSFSLNTTTLPDGVHDVRVVSYDNSAIKTQGRWVGQITTNNASHTATLQVVTPVPAPHDRNTLFVANVNSTGGTLSEIRLLQNGRVVAASSSVPKSFPLYGNMLGAGPIRLIAEAIYTDGSRALSAPATLQISYDPVAAPLGDCDGNGTFQLLPDMACFVNAVLGTDTIPAGGIARSDLTGNGVTNGEDIQRFVDIALAINHVPVAYGYTRSVPQRKPLILELPASDLENTNLTYTVVTPPSQATISGTGPMRIVYPTGSAMGTDTVTFFVSDGIANSNIATITLQFPNNDVAPPSPAPTWSTPPTPLSTSAVTMSCTTASDATPPINYYFDQDSGGGGGADSGWQLATTYTDTGLLPNRAYSYRVKSRDSAVPVNETPLFPLPPAAATGTATMIQTPTTVSFGTVTQNSIQVTADGAFTLLTTGSSGLFFEMTPAAGSGANVWVQTTSITVTGLSPNTNYSFRVKARNRNAIETPFGSTNNTNTLP